MTVDTAPTPTTGVTADIRTEPAAADRSRLARHWVFAVLLSAGAVLRVITWLAYPPALLYVDSFRYLDNVSPLWPNQLDPIGYDLFVLRPLLWLGGLRLITAVQHIGGLVMAIAVYALVLRLGGRRWPAALATVPVLLDGYQLQIEQNILSDLTFQLLLVGVLWLLVAVRPLRWRRAAAAGAVLAAAVLVRMVGITLIVPVLGYAAVAGGVWRTWAGRRQALLRCTALAGTFAVLLGGYACYYRADTGHWGLSPSSGNVLYGRTAQIADCSKLNLDAVMEQMCPAEPLGQRPGVDVYAHRDGDPNWPGVIPPGLTRTDLQHQFAMDVIKAQPLDVIRAVLTDFAKGFASTRTTVAGDVPVERWQFQTTYPLVTDPATTRAEAMQYGGVPPAIRPALATFLRAYQLGGGDTPGPALAAAAVLGLAGGLFGRRRPDGIRAATLLVACCGLGLLLTSAAFEFSWRYQLPGLVLLPVAGALGVNALLGLPRRRRRPPLAAFPDEVDSAALADFGCRYGEVTFAPLVVVIAAYNEGGGLGGVLDALPSRCGDLPVDVLVVVDGATDDTAEVSIRHGAYTCVAPRNRGQGGALRLGYRLAAARGARYVVTTDADGQYDNDELPLLLQPLLDDTADFVTGSRRLGREGPTARIRWVGVRVFATLASLLTWRRITDTSFGFRAMRAGLACSVVLHEPQYQSSELLLGAIGLGARVVEVPATMRPRSAGTSKKGRSLVYGANYARVMLTTWWRECVRGRHGTPAGPAPRT